MYAIAVTRSSFGDVVSGKLRPRETAESELPRVFQENNGALAIWNNVPDDLTEVLPAVLVTEPGMERDWIAWISSFMPSLRPFTGYCRVIDIERLRRAVGDSERQRRTLKSLQFAPIGLVLGELLALDRGGRRGRLAAPTVAMCVSTLAFVLMRNVALGAHSGADGLAKRWAAARRLLGAVDTTGPTEAVASAASVLASSGAIDSRHDDRLPRACRELATTGRVSPALLGEIDPQYESAVGRMEGSRDERVSVFENAMRQGVERGQYNQDTVFALGYLASRIAPGTLSHAQLLYPLADSHPGAVVWYAVCAGLSGPGLAAEVGGIGRRAMRELLEPASLYDRPRSDLSLAELEVLLGGERRLHEFVRWSNTYLRVELEPMVETVVPWGGRTLTVRRPDVTGGGDEERLRVASDLRLLSERLGQIARRLGEPELAREQPVEYRQESLLEDDDSRRTSRRRRR